MAVELDKVQISPLTPLAVSSPMRGEPLEMPAPADRLDDLTQIIQAYNQVTKKLQASHEALREQVVRLQHKLASTDARLQRSKRLAALGEMAAGIAHEIRNPLAAIQLYARMLVQDLSTAALPQDDARPDFGVCAETAEKIASAVRGLNAIVEDVLSFARHLVPRRTELLVANLFDRAIETQRPAIDAANIQVQCRHEGQLTLCADADLLHQALVNLIRNAVDTMACRPSPRGLTLGARAESGQAVLTVCDTGPGIGDEDIERIFNPFFTTRQSGTGLGLAIVHRIVEAHSGSITVHNENGAVFELSFPMLSNRDPRTQN